MDNLVWNHYEKYYTLGTYASIILESTQKYFMTFIYISSKKKIKTKPEFLFTIQTNLFSWRKFTCILKEFYHFMKFFFKVERKQYIWILNRKKSESSFIKTTDGKYCSLTACVYSLYE